MTIEKKYELLETIIVGDLNFNMLVKENNKLVEFIDTHGFSNTISKGTRRNPSKNIYTLLDVILCYFLKYLVLSTVINCSFSDHSLILAAFDFKKIYNKPERRLVRCLNKDSILTIKNSLNSILHSFTFIGTNVNEQWNVIRGIISSCIDSTAPLKQIPIKKTNNSPWIDKNYVTLVKKRDSLYYKALKLNSELLWREYKNFKNSCSNLFHKNKSLYFKNFINKTSTSVKKFWKKLSPFISPNKKTLLISSVILNNSINNSDLDLATSFCNYFSTITLIFDFLSLSLCISYVTNFLSTELNLRQQADMTDRLVITSFSREEVVKALQSLTANSGVGEVGIESIIFVECAEELGDVITNLFNLILSTGSYPDEWKCAHITPIYKEKGSKSSFENYKQKPL